MSSVKRSTVFSPLSHDIPLSTMDSLCSEAKVPQTPPALLPLFYTNVVYMLTLLITSPCLQTVQLLMLIINHFPSPFTCPSSLNLLLLQSFNHLFKDFGILESIVRYQETQFTFQVWEWFMEKLEVNINLPNPNPKPTYKPLPKPSGWSYQRALGCSLPTIRMPRHDSIHGTVSATLLE